MNELTQTNGPISMSSREIAELTGKEHRNVMRDIRAMLVELHGEGGALSFEQSYLNEQNKPQPCFKLPKRESLILVSGYSVPMRARIIDRWQELESAPVPLNPANLSRLQLIELAMRAEQERMLLENKVEELAPKAAALDMIAAGDETVTATQAAKVIGVKRSTMLARMHAEGWCYRQNESWVAYDRFIKNGCLQYKEAKYTDEKTGMEGHKPYFHLTPKGLVKLATLFGVNPPPANDQHKGGAAA